MSARVAVASCALIALGAVGCGERSTGAAAPALVDRTPAQVGRVLAIGEGSRSELVNLGDGAWEPEEGTAPESAVIMTDAESTFFPLMAYHELAVSADGSEYGLTDPAYILTAVDRHRKRVEVLIGAETFNGEGYYARRPGDDKVYLVPRKVVVDIRSLLSGQTVSVPHPVDEEIERIANRAERAESAPDVWLQQAEKAGADVPEDLR